MSSHPRLRATARRIHRPFLKAQIAIEALRGDATLAEVAARHGVRPSEVARWRRRLMQDTARWSRKSGQGLWLWI
ncbi:MAG TPA: transposase [Xanthobacteraceae bacterium]|nr:transposase [Xanthobacteraceae bacterium]